MAGPPCGLFIYMSRSFHGRQEMNGFLGDQNQFLVRSANQILVNLVVLLCIAHAREVMFMTLGAREFFVHHEQHTVSIHVCWPWLTK